MEALQKNRESVTERKLQLLTGARLHDLSQIVKAASVQDNIRRKVGKWQGAKEIQRWRTA
ncbi:MAG TPA: hypothetical protein VJI15_04655 [Candidatus Nanoarchaeia archaeon]|nr:hypothetical protein [Candidatus Nanoarchaeia archaeon]